MDHVYRDCDFNNPQAVCQRCGLRADGSSTTEGCPGTQVVVIDIRDGLHDFGRRKLAPGFLPEASIDDIAGFVQKEEQRLGKLMELVADMKAAEREATR